MSTLLLTTYHRLLADICRSRAVHLDTSDVITDNWLLNEGPKLEKQLLSYLEFGGEFPLFPEWLLPLSERFRLLDDPFDLRAIRQLLLFCYKIEYEPTQYQIQDAVLAFCDVDDTCELWSKVVPNYWDYLFRCSLVSSARRTIAKVLCNVSWSNITPFHGPGSVFPSFDPLERSNFDTIYRPIQQFFPFDKYFTRLPSFMEDRLVSSQDRIKEVDIIRCKLSAVPKDSRGPRLICVHPREAIWIQQGLRKQLELAIKTSWLTRRAIQFDDQSVNGSIAMLASQYQGFVTLDMKEASDRLSCRLIRDLFGDYVYEVLSCCRATEVVLPDGRVRQLQKWAPMGNCLTFPVESLVFWALVHTSIACDHGIDCGSIYVFGDDLIFPSKYYGSVIRALSMCGLVPNMAKTFRQGFFRESCGVDAYRGIDVTPIRMKKDQLVSYSNLYSTCELAKRLLISGYTDCSAHLYSCVRRALGSLHLSNNPDTQGIYEYVGCDLGHLSLLQRIRFNRNLHRWEAPYLQVRNSTVRAPQHDWCHVLDSLNRLELSPLDYEERGTEYPVPYRERSTYGWGSVVAS